MELWWEFKKFFEKLWNFFRGSCIYIYEGENSQEGDGAI
jgi:hypothetical protein